MISHNNRERLLASTILVGATALSLMGAGPVIAQSPTPAAGQPAQPTVSAEPAATVETNTVGEVVITGSRISRRDYVADSPIVSVAPKAIENTGAVSLDQVFNQIPQFVGSYGSQSNNPGNGGQVNINLRGLGGQRNLVLLDGRRIQPSNIEGVIDINILPAALIDSIEVVTGGQTTAYGSDAIAGVTNFKLKHNFQGVVLDASYGVSEKGDAQQQNVALTIGGNFGDERGNAVLSLGYSNRDPVYYGARPNVTLANYADLNLTDPRILAVSGLSSTKPTGDATFLAGNQPSQAAVTGLFAGYGVPAATAGKILRSYRVGFNNDGTLFNGSSNYKGPTTIDYSTIYGTPTASNAGSYNTGALNYILVPLTRYNAYGDVEYAVTPHVRAYGQFIFANYTASSVLAPTPATGNPGGVPGVMTSGGTGFLVGANNPFIPADLRTLLNARADPGAPFVFSKRFNELGARLATDEYTTYQLTTGLKGDVPGRDITFDLYASFGHYNDSNDQFGNVSHVNFAAVLANPATAGSGACATYNPFGVSTIPAACRSFISPQTKNQLQTTQRIVEFDVQGHAFTLPKLFDGVGGDEVRFAFGADYRDNKGSFSPDALLSSLDNTVNSYTLNGKTYNLANNTVGVAGFNAGQALTGDIDVYEVYGELLVPLVKDLPLARSINLDLGTRLSSYSTIGQAFTYKADLEWKITGWLLARGGYSRAIRAPNVAELFFPASFGYTDYGSPSPTNLGVGDPCDVGGAARQGKGVSAAAVRALCLAQGVPASIIDTFTSDYTQLGEFSGGNPNLQQERANTYTGGFVIQPHFSHPMFNKISASVDYYNIEVRGAIGSVDPLTQLSSCFNENGSNPTYSNAYALCGDFIRDPATGQLTSGNSLNQNLGALSTSGIDLQVDWSFALSAVPWAHVSDRFGSLAFNLTANWLNDYNQQNVPGGAVLNSRDSIFSGPGGYFPVWRALLNASWSVGPFDLGVSEQYLGSARDGSCIGLSLACAARGVDPTFYTNLNARWRINDVLEMRAGVTNATGQEPRFFTSAASSEGYTDSSTYDLIGRSYFVGLKARF